MLFLSRSVVHVGSATMNFFALYQHNMKARFLVLLLFVASMLGQLAQAEEVFLTPREVTGLYLKAFVNHDMESAKKLNDYSRPMLKGKDLIDREMLEKMSELFQEMGSESFLQGFSAEDQQKLKPVVRDFFKTVIDALYRSQCEVVWYEMMPDQEVEGHTIAYVDYVCKVVDVKLDQAQLREMNQFVDDNVTAQLQSLLRGVIASVEQAQVTREVKGQQVLRDLGDQQNWFTETPGDVMSTVLDAVLDTVVP